MTTTLETSATEPAASPYPLAWLPFDAGPLAPLPDGLRVVSAHPSSRVPDEIGDVEFLAVLNPGQAPLADLVPRMPRLRVVQTLSAGVEGVAQHLPAHVTLCNGKGIHDAATAELAVTLTLAAQRDIPAFRRRQLDGTWVAVPTPGLTDKRVLILGYGSIGAAIEARLAGFEVDVVRVASRPRDGVAGIGELGDLLPTADVVIVIVPLTGATRGLIDAEFLARMKDGALLVNVARGPVVVTDDLVAALRDGEIAGAAMDVTDPEPLPDGHPLWRLPNCTITPHIAATGRIAQQMIAPQVIANAAAFEAGERMPTEVDITLGY